MSAVNPPDTQALSSPQCHFIVGVGVSACGGQLPAHTDSPPTASMLGDTLPVLPLDAKVVLGRFGVVVALAGPLVVVLLLLLLLVWAGHVRGGDGRGHGGGGPERVGGRADGGRAGRSADVQFWKL